MRICFNSVCDSFDIENNTLEVQIKVVVRASAYDT